MNNTAILIGNSDDKLSQVEWSLFVDEVRIVLNRANKFFYFTGGSNPESSFQNYCFVVSGSISSELWEELDIIRLKYKQEAIAIISGISTMIGNPNYKENNG